MSNPHEKTYKNRTGITTNEVKNRVYQTSVELRKTKRDDVMQKRRNITDCDEVEEVFGSETVQELITGWKNGNDEEKLETIKKARKLLSSDKNPPIDEMINNHEMLSILIEALCHSSEAVQFEAAWSLTNIASGTSQQTRAVVAAVPFLIKLLLSDNENVSEQSLWALGNIIGDGPELRDSVIDQGLMHAILYIFNRTNVPQISFLRNLAWVFVNICRNKNPPPSIEIVKQIVPILRYFLQHMNDPTMIIDTIWTISYITDHGNDGIELVIEFQLVELIVPLLLSDDLKIQTPALRVIGNIVTGNDEQTQYVLDQNVLQYMPRLLDHPKEKIKKEALWFISNITAGSEEQIQSLINHNIIQSVIPFLRNGSFILQREAAWVISNMTHNGSKKQIDYLVNIGVISPICETLTLNDSQIKQLLLESLLKILSSKCPDGGDIETVRALTDQIEACGGLDTIESLQEDPNDEIYKLSLEIIEKFFSDIVD